MWVYARKRIIARWYPTHGAGREDEERFEAAASFVLVENGGHLGAFVFKNLKYTLCLFEVTQCRPRRR